MKTQNSLIVIALFAMAIFVTSCGDGGKAAKEKATADSIRVADSLTAVQLIQSLLCQSQLLKQQSTPLI